MEDWSMEAATTIANYKVKKQSNTPNYYLFNATNYLI